MFLATLSLHNFKNFGKANVEFPNGIICIAGENGSGKTNLLDAIHYLSVGKSAFNSFDNQNIQHGKPLFSVSGDIDHDGKSISIQCFLKRGEKKILKVNNQEYDKLSEHVGKYPVVLVAPDDSDLVREHSEARRKFVDGILCQLSADYLSGLMKYHSYLKQRNGALKSMYEEKKVDKTLLEAYDKELLALNRYLCDFRSDFVNQFIPYLNRFYKEISEGKEEISLLYKTSVSRGEFEKKFRSNVDRDLALQRTELGVHRDDFVFEINSHGLKKFGSQGQQKSFIISLKFAHYEFIKAKKNLSLILLLDDIFDKLDDGRITMLMKLVNSGRFGQIFITDAREKRIRDIIKKNKIEASFIRIEDNSINPC